MVVPLYVQLANVIPAMKVQIQNLKSNAEKWSTYEETEKDKQVYIKLAGDMEQIKEEQEDAHEETSQNLSKANDDESQDLSKVNEDESQDFSKTDKAPEDFQSLSGDE